MPLAEGLQRLPMEGGRTQKPNRVNNVVGDNSQQRITWGGSGGLKEGSTQLMRAASALWIS